MLNYLGVFSKDTLQQCGGYWALAMGWVDLLGIGGSLVDCRPVLPKGRKYQMVKTQTESHVRRLVV